jgi:hypothetical protein
MNIGLMSITAAVLLKMTALLYTVANNRFSGPFLLYLGDTELEKKV